MRLNFLDMMNYLAPGFSYDKYMKAYRCEVTKYHFPCEYKDSLEKLDDTGLPPKEVFYSRMKNEGISDEDYARFNKIAIQAKCPDDKWTRKPLAYRKSLFIYV